LALIISNSAYPTEGLPAGVDDAAKMTTALKAADFDVTAAPNELTQIDLVNKDLLPFLNRVKPGDIVVIYYFGHGFSHGADNFLVPVGASTSIPEEDIYDVFLPERAIRDMAAERQPGLVLLFLDACRVVIQFANAGAPAPLVAQAPPSQNQSTDIAVSYAADYGDSAYAPSKTAVSFYTNALSNDLPVAGVEFSDLQKKLTGDVSDASKYIQKAWLLSDLESYFYFISTPAIQEKERLLWQATVQDGTRAGVTNFLRQNRGSIYAGEAAQWLNDHPEDQPGARLTYTQVSALTPEALWGSNNDLVSFPKISATLGIPRTLTANFSDDVQSFSDASRKALIAASPHAIVTAKSLQATGATNNRLSLPFGQTLDIPQFESGALTASTQIAGAMQTITLPQSATRGGTIKVGRALAEVELEPDHLLPEIIDPDAIKSKLEPATAKAKVLGWVSISTPFSSNKKQQTVYALQATFVRYELTLLGVPESKITILNNNPDNHTNLRVRIFGLPF